MMHGGWWRVGRQFGSFDAAFLPINGATFSWRKPATDEPAVLTPKQAVAAATILGAERIVPIHYGVVGADGYSEVPDPLGALQDASRHGGSYVTVLKPGEWLNWQERQTARAAPMP